MSEDRLLIITQHDESAPGALCEVSATNRDTTFFVENILSESRNRIWFAGDTTFVFRSNILVWNVTEEQYQEYLKHWANYKTVRDFYLEKIDQSEEAFERALQEEVFK